MDTKAKTISVYGMTQGCAEIFEDKTSDMEKEGVSCELFKYKNTRNIIIPIDHKWIGDLFIRWGNVFYDKISNELVLFTEALFRLQQFFYSHMVEYIIVVYQSGPYTNKGLGAVQVIASFNPEGLDLYNFNEMRIFFSVLRQVNTGIPLEFEICEKTDFALEIKHALDFGQILCKGGSSVHWPFYGWSL